MTGHFIKFIIPILKYQNKNMKNANTTIMGVLTIISALAYAGLQIMKTGSCDFAATSAALFAGWGLIKARDAQ